MTATSGPLATFRPFRAKLLQGLAMFLDVGWSEVKEVGDLEKLYVDRFVGNDAFVLRVAPNDAHADRKWRHRMAERGASRPHIRPILCREDLVEELICDNIVHPLIRQVFSRHRK